MSARTVLLDMTQFVSHPRATGIQRVLLAMAQGLRPEGVDVRPAARLDGVYVVVEPGTAVDVLEAQFERRAAGAGEPVDVRGRWLSRAVGSIVPEHLPRVVDGFLLAELTSAPTTLDDLDLLRRAGTATAAVFYDALPVLHPVEFSGWDQVVADRYFRTVAALDDVAFISDAVRREFETRLARRPVPNGVVAFPGVDQTRPDHRPAPVPPRLVCVGAVEPRKRTDVVVEAVRRLRAAGSDVELVVVGGVSTGHRGFVAGLREQAAAGTFTWLEDASDAEVADLVASSTAMVYAGEREGYGLPPLEALRTGVPCVTARRLPSLEAVGPEGLVVVDRFGPDEVTDALAGLLVPGEAERLRERARAARTPTWSDFNDRLAELLLGSLARSDARR